VADPVIEIIAKKVEAALKAIVLGQTNSAGVSYQVQPVNVFRPTRQDKRACPHGTILLKQVDYDVDIENNAQGDPPAVANIVTFAVRIHIAPRDDDATPIDTLINVWRSDIESCLMLDPQWDGTAYNSILLPAERYIDQNNAESGVDVLINVYYAVSENDPYTQRSA
jgi:hypothetical protein